MVGLLFFIMPAFLRTMSAHPQGLARGAVEREASGDPLAQAVSTLRGLHALCRETARPDLPEDDFRTFVDEFSRAVRRLEENIPHAVGGSPSAAQYH